MLAFKSKEEAELLLRQLAARDVVNSWNSETT